MHYNKFSEYLDVSFSEIEKDRTGVIRELEGANAAEIKIGGRNYIQLASNNYLGITTHPRVKEAVLQAVDQFGVGAGGARQIAANFLLYRQFEQRLASFMRVEAAMLMPSGFMANVATLSALMRKGDLIVTDELNHASIIDGIRLSGAERRIYPHGDMKALEENLKEADKYGKCLVVTDGVFSMDGDIAKLPDILELAQRYGAAVMLDDAHAIGVLGQNGTGTAEHFRIEKHIEIRVGTLSKAFGLVGGFVVGSERLIAVLKRRSRPFLFSTALPPAIVAGAIAALDVVSSEPALRNRLWENTEFFQNGLKENGFDIGRTNTPITPVIVGDTRRAGLISKCLEDAGVFATPIMYPVVAKGAARIRAIVMATHTRDHLTKAIGAFVLARSRL